MFWFIPFVTVMPTMVGKDMGWVFGGAAAMFVSTLATGIIIIIGAALPPGPWADGRIRYISDGFKDYPGLPLVSLFLLALQVGIFIWFTRQANILGPSYAKQEVMGIMQMTGATSVVGMAMVAAFPEGAVHLVGAGLFIVSYLAMHHVLDRIMVQTELLLEDQVRRDEWWVLGGSGFFLLFGGLLAAGMAMQGDAATTVKSASAFSEYLVFGVFVGLNLYGMGMMTRVCVEYELGLAKVAGYVVNDGKKKWIKRKGEDTFGSYVLIPPPNIRLHHPDPSCPVVMRIPSTWT